MMRVDIVTPIPVLRSVGMVGLRRRRWQGRKSRFRLHSCCSARPPSLGSRRMSPRTAPRILHIALDACDADLMRRLAAEGRCPNIAALLRDSAVADTVAPFGT